MSGLLLVLPKSKIRHWLPWKQKYFTVAYRNWNIFINCAISLTFDIEDSTHQVYDFYREIDFYSKIIRKIWKKNKVLINIYEYAIDSFGPLEEHISYKLKLRVRPWI